MCGFSGQKISKCLSHKFLDKKNCQNFEGGECVCVLMAIASNTLILGWIDTFGIMILIQALVNIGAEQNEDTK